MTASTARTAAELPNPYTGGSDWFHGTHASPDELNGQFADPAAIHPDAYQGPDAEEGWSWTAVLGTHFTADHEIAGEYARGEHESVANSIGGEGFDGEHIVHGRLAIASPAAYDSEHDMIHEAYEAEWAAGNHPSKHLEGDEYAEEYWPVASAVMAQFGDSQIPREASGRCIGGDVRNPARMYWLASHPDKHGIAVRFRERLQAADHDGVLYRNEHETSFRGAAANTCAITFSPDQIAVTAHHEADDPCAEAEPWADREAC
jgi:hypothetical protein